jgi:lysophospholipase L1-like esterase
VRYPGTYAPEAGQNWDDQHDATWGRLIWQEKDAIQDIVRLQAPDLMVVDLGTNDLNPVFGGSSPVGAAENLRQLIRNARSGNPDLDIVLIQIPQVGQLENYPSGVSTYIPTYATILEWIARTEGQALSRIQLANVFGNYDWRTDDYDQVHPNRRGEHLIAREVANALWDGWGYGGAYGPVPPPDRDLPVDPPSVPRGTRFTVVSDGAVDP